MPYLGNVPATNFSTMSYQDLTGGTGTSFTLNFPAGSAQDIEVYVNNVRQEPGVAYTVSGTALTMTGSIASTDDFYVVFQGKAQQTVTPGSNTITAAMLQSSAVTNIKIDTMAASKLTGALPAIDGSALTGVGVSVARVSETISTASAGTFTASAWQTRALNTEDFDPDNIVTLSSNQFTLGAGKYLCYFDASAFKVARHTAKIYNITDSDNAAIGLAAYSASTLDLNSVSSGFGFINITGSKVFELQHYATTTKTTNGLGSGTVTLAPNTFSSVTIIKVG